MPDKLAGFSEIWLHDFEFCHPAGEALPDVVCLAAREIRSGRTFKLWRNELNSVPPYRIGDDTLFVSYAAHAEMSCHASLRWPLARNILDLNVLFKRVVNGVYKDEQGKKIKRSLIDALKFYRLENIGAAQKEAMQQRVLRGWPFTADEQRDILAYCFSDIEALEKLLPKLLAEPGFRLDIELFNGEVVAALTLMQLRGIPIDTATFSSLAKAWARIRDDMVPTLGAKYGVFVRKTGGDYAFNMKLFEAYLAREGILASWPRTPTGRLKTDEDTFSDICRAWPQLNDLRELRHVQYKMRNIGLAVGSDGRNRTILWPYATKTSRNAPSAAEYVYGPSTWVRSLIKPGPGTSLGYCDYLSMEFGIAAALSDGHAGSNNPMWDIYESGDPYLGYAKAVGAVPANATKKSHPEARNIYKVMLLAVQYGMGPVLLAARLGVSVLKARHLLEQHHLLFSQYWAWSEDFVQHSLSSGVMRSKLGWTCRTGITEFNKRSLRNWPIQTTGADILRVAIVMATRHGLRLVAPVHDALLLEAPTDCIEADVAITCNIMERASRAVLNGNHSGRFVLRAECDQLVKFPSRYMDKRGETLWRYAMERLDHYASEDLSAAAG